MASANQAHTDDVDIEFLRRLADAGYENFLVISLETAEEVLTPKRLELIELIRQEDPSSIRDLARIADRDPSNVFEDLQLLFEIGIVEFEEEKGKKAPIIGPDNVIVEPIL